MTGMSLLTVVKGMRKLTWQIWRENGVRSTTLENRPTISGIRNVEMKKRERGDPDGQPCQDQKTPLEECSHLRASLDILSLLLS
jgi:hypothetical protein